MPDLQVCSNSNVYVYVHIKLVVWMNYFTVSPTNQQARWMRSHWKSSRSLIK